MLISLLRVVESYFVKIPFKFAPVLASSFVFSNFMNIVIFLERSIFFFEIEYLFVCRFSYSEFIERADGYCILLSGRWWWKLADFVSGVFQVLRIVPLLAL
eukprot:TRINITY_DN7111_c0_g1_i5.p1 TRINITY_DN7111_c0_g1~~TRINITY_DN7111_c0_g1_i5.p1  ORF type:complete len:101 (+),score=19.53 TRINITY_DN7111_c0_g1_i5:364-666(+)